MRIAERVGERARVESCGKLRVGIMNKKSEDEVLLVSTRLGLGPHSPYTGEPLSLVYSLSGGGIGRLRRSLARSG